MELAYGKKSAVALTRPEKLPAAKDMQVAAGGHLKGCRIGFDLGASDHKVSAVADGDAIASSWPEFGNAARFSKRKDRVNIFAGWPA